VTASDSARPLGKFSHIIFLLVEQGRHKKKQNKKAKLVPSCIWFDNGEVPLFISHLLSLYTPLISLGLDTYCIISVRSKNYRICLQIYDAILQSALTFEITFGEAGKKERLLNLVHMTDEQDRLKIFHKLVNRFYYAIIEISKLICFVGPNGWWDYCFGFLQLISTRNHFLLPRGFYFFFSWT
jgi:hypothetical protein